MGATDTTSDRGTRDDLPAQTAAYQHLDEPVMREIGRRVVALEQEARDLRSSCGPRADHCLLNVGRQERVAAVDRARPTRDAERQRD